MTVTHSRPAVGILLVGLLALSPLVASGAAHASVVPAVHHAVPDEGGIWDLTRTVLKVIAGLIALAVISIVLMPIAAIIWRLIRGDHPPGKPS